MIWRGSSKADFKAFPEHVQREMGYALFLAQMWKSAEVDYRVPLFRVWSEYRDAPWPQLLDYWGLPNPQVINRDVHAAKCAAEARDRHVLRHLASELN